MQTITTKYMAPTNTLGARIKATSTGTLSVTVHYDYALDTQRNHNKAAMALCEKVNWKNFNWAIGGTKNGFVYVPVINMVEL